MEKLSKDSRALLFYSWLLALFGLAGVAASYAWNLALLEREIPRPIRWRWEDLSYRLWNATYGPLYAPVSDKLPPNPHLDVAHRDIPGPAGQMLTAVNPSYMTRLVQEFALAEFGHRGRITSLLPIRPENRPDPWEERALRRIEGGAAEVSEVAELEGVAHLRLMRPMVTAEACLRCHAAQGYHLGDIRGGLSVSIPLAPYQPIFQSRRRSLLMGHLFFVGAGLLGLGAATIHLRRQMLARERAERELQRAKDAAERANLLKSQFLANMSHEIRTPMNGVIGMIGLARDLASHPEQVEMLKLADQSATSLLTLLNDILDLSRIEADKLKIEHQPFDPRALIQQILAEFTPLLREKNLHCACEIDPALAPRLLGDSFRVRQVLVNLLGNAVKFTDQGGLSLCVEKGARKNAQGVELVRFAVKDSGIGIAEDKLSELFQLFSQVDGSLTRRHGGSGLGLAISRKLVELMGGYMDVESRPGEGSTFTFFLPLPEA